MSRAARQPARPAAGSAEQPATKAAGRTAGPVRRRPAGPSTTAADAGQDVPFVEQVDASFLESLLGYNARRAALAVIEVFLQRMAVYQLRPVDFSVLSLIVHNPGITSRQLCTSLGILPPNLVNLVGSLERRGLVDRRPHPRDGRATGLHPTPAAHQLMRKAERTAAQLEADVAMRLTPAEVQTLLGLLRKLYRAD
jgi:DNA-binding MarR family transcriptional regulator